MRSVLRSLLIGRNHTEPSISLLRPDSMENGVLQDNLGPRFARRTLLPTRKLILTTARHNRCAIYQIACLSSGRWLSPAALFWRRFITIFSQVSDRWVVALASMEPFNGLLASELCSMVKRQRVARNLTSLPIVRARLF